MPEVYKEFDARGEHLLATMGDTDEYFEARLALRSEFAQALANHYLPGVPKEIQDKVMEMAWEYGTNIGWLHAVECFYREYAEFAMFVLKSVRWGNKAEE